MINHYRPELESIHSEALNVATSMREAELLAIRTEIDQLLETGTSFDEAIEALSKVIRRILESRRAAL